MKLTAGLGKDLRLSRGVLKDAFKTCFQLLACRNLSHATMEKACRNKEHFLRVEDSGKTVFGCLQESIFSLGYRLAESGRERVGQALSESVKIRQWLS